MHSWSSKAFQFDNIGMVKLLQYHNFSGHEFHALWFRCVKTNLLQCNNLSSVTISGLIHIAISPLAYLKYQNNVVTEYLSSCQTNDKVMQ